MFDNLNFGDVQEQKFEILPAGKHAFICDSLELKQSTKNPENGYIAAKFRVIRGDHKGRTVFQNYNVVHDNEKVADIGKRQFKSYLTAVGKPDFVLTPKNLKEIINYKFTGTVKHKNNPGAQDEKYATQPEIVHYEQFVEEEAAPF